MVTVHSIPAGTVAEPFAGPRVELRRDPMAVVLRQVTLRDRLWQS